MKAADKCIDEGTNLLVTGEMGIGNTTSTSAIASAVFSLPAEETVGRGSGINDERMKIKRHIVTKALAINKPKSTDGLDILSKIGGYEHAGLVGMILAGAARGVPTMLDGVNATAAALLAGMLCPDAKKYMFASHLSEETIHQNMLEQLHLKPIINAHMRLGEGTGAMLAIAFLNMAMDVYNNA